MEAKMQFIPTAPPPPPISQRQLDDARTVVEHPELTFDQPAMRVNAWDTLKRARGQHVNLSRLDAMQHTLRNTRSLGAHLLNPGAV
jgi:hypothetical protein